MITADQIVAHLVGDYILQSDWMANEKTKRSVAALAHVLCYSLPFLFFRPSLAAWAFIVVTHFVIDRWRLARYVVWAKNLLSPKVVWQVSVFPDFSVKWVDRPMAVDAPDLPPAEVFQKLRTTPPWDVCRATGYPPDRPVWLAVWLLIIADNTLHLICNGIALKYF